MEVGELNFFALLCAASIGDYDEVFTRLLWTLVLPYIAPNVAMSRACLCLRAYLKNHDSILHQCFSVLAVAVAQCSSDDNAVRCVFPVLLMTSSFTNGQTYAAQIGGMVILNCDSQEANTEGKV